LPMTLPSFSASVAKSDQRYSLAIGVSPWSVVQFNFYDFVVGWFRFNKCLGVLFLAEGANWLANALIIPKNDDEYLHCWPFSNIQTTRLSIPVMRFHAKTQPSQLRSGKLSIQIEP